MHSTKTLIFSVILAGALLFFAGHFLWGNDDGDNPQTTPSPSTRPTVSASPSRSPVAYTVRLTAAGPVPATLTIKAGDSVSLVSEDPEGFAPRSNICVGFDALRTLVSGERYTVTFAERRTCTYYDNRMPAAMGRQGTIIVQ